MPPAYLEYFVDFTFSWWKPTAPSTLPFSYWTWPFFIQGSPTKSVTQEHTWGLQPLPKSRQDPGWLLGARECGEIDNIGGMLAFHDCIEITEGIRVMLRSYFTNFRNLDVQFLTPRPSLMSDLYKSTQLFALCAWDVHFMWLLIWGKIHCQEK